MIASPTLTSAAATTIIKNTKICASLTTLGLDCATTDAACIFENATSNKFTAFSINSIHIKMMMEFRRVSTPTIPVQNNATAKPMYHLISILISSLIKSNYTNYTNFFVWRLIRVISLIRVIKIISLFYLTPPPQSSHLKTIQSLSQKE